MLQNRSPEASYFLFLKFCLKKVSGRSNVSILSERQSSLSNKLYDRNQTLQWRFPIVLALIDLIRLLQWCRRRGCRGSKGTPKNFDLLRIWAKSLKIRTKPKLSRQNPWNSGLKWRAAFVGKQMKAIFLEVTPKNGPQKLEDNCLGKFGQKFFPPPKSFLLLHLWLALYQFFTVINYIRD